MFGTEIMEIQEQNRQFVFW